MKEALKLALEALEEIALAGMSGTGQESKEAMTEWHARQAWRFIGIAALQLTAIKAVLAQSEQENLKLSNSTELEQPEQEPVEYKIGQEVRVTRLTYGGAVYNSKREIINANQPPHKTVCIGRIVEIKQECENGAVIVKCEGDDKFLPRFHFYPQDNGPAQIVEISAQSKELKHEPEIWLDLEKLTAGGMAYATNFQSTTKQSMVYTTPPQPKEPEQEPVAWMSNAGGVVLTGDEGSDDWYCIPLYTTPPQRKPLTDEQIYELWTEQGLANSYDIYSLKEHVRRAARAIEAAHGIKE